MMGYDMADELGFVDGLLGEAPDAPAVSQEEPNAGNSVPGDPAAEDDLHPDADPGEGHGQSWDDLPPPGEDGWSPPPQVDEAEAEDAAAGEGPAVADPPMEDGLCEGGPVEPVGIRAAVSTGASAHSDRVIAAIAADDREIEAYARFFNIDPRDPHPGAEALILLKALMDASSKVGEALASGGDRLMARMDAGTAGRAEAARKLAEAAAALDAASRALEGATREAEARSAAGAESLAAAAEGVKTRVGQSVANTASIVKPQIARVAEETIDGAMARAVEAVAAASEEAKSSAVMALDDAAIKAAATVDRIVDGLAPRIEEAVSRGIARSEKSRAEADPWRWRKTAIAAVALVACMLVSGVMGRSAGYQHGHAEGAAKAARVK